MKTFKEFLKEAKDEKQAEFELTKDEILKLVDEDKAKVIEGKVEVGNEIKFQYNNSDEVKSVTVS